MATMVVMVMMVVTGTGTGTETGTEKSIGQRRFQNQGENTISSIVGAYKSAVSKYAHRLGYEFAWQSGFYDHVIRNEKSFSRISEYIINNPKNWEKGKFYTERNKLRQLAETS